MTDLTLGKWGGAGVLLLVASLGGCSDNGNDVGFEEMSDGGSGGTGAEESTGTVTSSNDTSATSTSSSTETDGGGGSTNGGGASAEGSGGSSGSSSTTGDGGSAAADASTGSSVGGSGGTEQTTGGTGGSGGTEQTTGGTGGSGGTEQTTGGAGGTEGGAGGATTSGGSGGTGGEAHCPTERPAAETECSPNGLECSYTTDCGDVQLACNEGHWVLAPGLPPSCETFASGNYPENGQACGCVGELRCQFLDCEDRGNIQAVCNGETWEVQTKSCESTPCGPQEGETPLRCEAGQICVIMETGGPASQYHCEANPCLDGGHANSCDCALGLCGGSANIMCEMRAENTVVACTCPACN